MCDKLDSQVISFSICLVASFIRSALVMPSSLLTSSPASLKWCLTSCMHFTMTPSMSVLPERGNMNPKLELFVASLKSWGKKLSIASTLCNADRLLNNVVKLATAQCLIPEKLPCKVMRGLKKMCCHGVLPNSTSFRNSSAPSASLSNLRI